jgi:uncharacterized YkwD family protein
LTSGKKALVSLLVTLFVFALVVPMASAEAVDNGLMEQQVVDQINQARTQNGMPMLQLDSALTVAAKQQAQLLANSDGSNYSEVYKLRSSGQYQAVQASVLRTADVAYLVNMRLSDSSFVGLSEQYNLVGAGTADSATFGKITVVIFAQGQSVAQQVAPTVQTTLQTEQPQNITSEQQLQETQPEHAQPEQLQPEQTQPQQIEQTSVNSNQIQTQGTQSVSGFQQRVVELVNQERAKVGLNPVVPMDDLTKVAQVKAEDMATNNYFSHTSPTYGSPFDMMKQFGINYSHAGENIAMGYSTPEKVMEGWMNSEGHKKNILNPNFTEIGVGFTTNGNYWVQEFAKR